MKESHETTVGYHHTCVAMKPQCAIITHMYPWNHSVLSSCVCICHYYGLSIYLLRSREDQFKVFRYHHEFGVQEWPILKSMWPVYCTYLTWTLFSETIPVMFTSWFVCAIISNIMMQLIYHMLYNDYSTKRYYAVFMVQMNQIVTSWVLLLMMMQC